MPPQRNAQQQRRMRNRDEREVIRQTVLESLTLARIDDKPGAEKLIGILADFVACADTARQFDGCIEVPEVGAKIEYMLPGRRLLRHYVRLAKMDDASVAAAAAAAQPVRAEVQNAGAEAEKVHPLSQPIKKIPAIL